MKKTSKAASKLLLSIESIRRLQPVAAEHLRNVGGGIPGCGGTMCAAEFSIVKD